MAKYLAVLLTVPQAQQLIEGGRRWELVKTMHDGPGRDMHAAQAVRNGIANLERAIEDAER